LWESREAYQRVEHRLHLHRLRHENIRLGWRGLPDDKHSNLLQTFINYGRKMYKL
jgi:hypothetical protein